MPLSEKDSRKLIADLAKYIEQDKWTKQDIGELEKAGKITKEDADFLRKKQSQANKKRDKLEQEIAKTIVTRFPARFGKPRVERKEVAEKEIKEVVVPKEEPEVLEIKKGVLERINDTLALQADYFHAFEGIAKEQLEAFKIIRDIEEEDKALRENISEITYPPGGGEKTIPTGMTVLDLWTGDVTLGDGTEDHLSDSLMAVGQLYARSIYVDCNKKFTVQLDGKSTHTIAADDFFSRKGIQCQRVFIDVDEATKLKFWSSTNPDATIEEMRNVVVTGVETPLASRQAYWCTRVSGYLLADERSGTLTIYNIPENVRLILNEINITCEKSLISLVDFGIAALGEEPYWRRRRYDTQGEFKFKDMILTAGEQLKVKVWNDINEKFYFHLEALGLEEAV